MSIPSGLARALDALHPRSDVQPPPASEAPCESPQPADHVTCIVDRNFGIRLPGRRYFVVVRIGRERRTPDRLIEEGQQRLPLATLVYCSIAGAFFMGFGMLCALYLLKSVAGINLMAQDSPLHPLYRLVFG